MFREPGEEFQLGCVGAFKRRGRGVGRAMKTIYIYIYNLGEPLGFRGLEEYAVVFRFPKHWFPHSRRLGIEPLFIKDMEL